MLTSNVDNAPLPADGEPTNGDVQKLKAMSIKGFLVSPATVDERNNNMNDVNGMRCIFFILETS